MLFVALNLYWVFAGQTERRLQSWVLASQMSSARDDQ